MELSDQFALSAEAIVAALHARAFGHLVTPGPEGLEVTSIPLLYNETNHSLVGHVARANPQWKYTDHAESLAVVPGTDAYVTPEYYPSKPVRPKVVPTWNYEVLYVYGQLEAHEDKDWLLDHVTALTRRHEAGRPTEWQVTDAPEKFIARQLRGIVGVELRIDRVIGKAKLSQNRSAEDRSGVVRGLAKGTLTERATAAAMTANGLDSA
ncbi:FMN-binding negative transcriptional regulator [Crossiella sp. CA198]|uniref:FMN-binding negative transcriptional regulator n=1 Tax=Crossiella sp. CA198 TaxID=3455607 RepID=UPI003F8D0418